MTIYYLPSGTEYGFRPRYTTDKRVATEWLKRGLDVQTFVKEEECK